MSYSDPHHYAPWPSPAESAVEYTDSFTQIESSIGPSRVVTRGQRKQSAQRPPLRSSSRADSPSTALTMPATTSMTTTTGYPLTPDSTTYSPYPTYHSRSNSASNPHHRSASPALSTVTSISSHSHSGAPNSNSGLLSPFARSCYSPVASPSNHVESPSAVHLQSRPKQRKQRLFNVDRQAICQFHLANPTARQEDIAARYGVERSTISKILKHKTKWLNVNPDEGLRVAKHRPSKFPEIESAMLEWIQSPATVRKSLSDTRLREKALSLAKSFHITEDKFKASSGWVENFKHRHGIRNGIYEGSGRNASIARALGAGAEGIEDLVDFDKRDILSRDNHGGASVDRSRDVDDDEHAYSPVATTGHNDFQRVLRSHGQQHPASGGLPRQTYRRASWAASDVADDSSQMNEDTDMGAQLSHSTQSSQSSSHARHTHHTSQHGPPYHPDQSSGRHQDQPPTSYHRDSYPFNHQPAPSSSAPSSTSSTSSHHLSYPSQMYSSHDMQPPALPAINTNLPPSQPSSSSSVHPIQQPTPVEGPSMPYEPRHQASSDSNLLPPVSPSGRRMIPQIAMGPMLELPLPRLPDNSPPTLEDAEMALNRVILYVDTFPPGQSILTLEQRQHLDEIKVVLFKAGAGLPLR